jgi:5'-deoxy-5'-methylthioadenosine phosphorylase
MLAIIGGTGLDKLTNLEISHRQVIRTPYGEPSGALMFGIINGHHVVFLPRHGAGHRIPPHEINYRANLWALQSQNVKRIVAVASVGGIRADLLPGTLVSPHQIIDYTYGRKFTFFEGGDKPLTHIDFTEPYCAVMRKRLLKASKAANVKLVDGAVYAATQGPRLETAAEITRIERDGGDLVGMTGMPEAALAKELGLSYATLAVVANFAAGRGDSLKRVDLEGVGPVLEQGMTKVRALLEQVVAVDEN